MRELNIEFQEKYKRLDKLCKEMYNSNEGVSAYIQDMEYVSHYGYAVYEWNYVYKQLKHMRWMRNQLAHELDIDTQFCEQSDIDWLDSFYNSILNGTDPLTYVRKAKQQTRTTKTVNNYEPQQTTVEEKPRKSLLSRIVAKIKSWF